MVLKDSPLYIKNLKNRFTVILPVLLQHKLIYQSSILFAAFQKNYNEELYLFPFVFPMPLNYVFVKLR